MLNLTLDAFVEQCHGASVRLHNAIRYAASENNLPYSSLRAYLQAGPERVDALLKLPSLGRKTVDEFDRYAIEAEVAEDMQQEKRQENISAAEEEAAQPDSLDISLLDFLARQPNVGVRLWRIVQAASQDGSCPYATVTEYLGDGPKRLTTLRKLPGLGATVAREFEELVQTALRRHYATRPSAIPESFNVSLADFLARQPVVSARLWRIIHLACDEGECPYATVADYLRAGVERVDILRKLPSLGSRSADEFDELAHAALQRGSVEPLPTVASQAEGFPDLEVLMNRLFDSLTERESNLLLDRIRPTGTLEAVAQNMGVTRERVRQIEVKIVKKLNAAFGNDFKEALALIEREYRKRNVRECTLHELAAFAGCDVVTCDMFFRFLDKLKVAVPASRVLVEGLNIICPDEFAPQETWNERIAQALINARWPLVFAEFVEFVADVPRYYLEKHLTERYQAVVEHDAFLVVPRLSSAQMCVQVLTQARKPLRLAEIRAGVFKHFEVDLSIHHVTSVAGAAENVLICASGTYVRYADVPYSTELIGQIRNAVHAELNQRQVFLGAKNLFDQLFAADLAYYPEGFNSYFVLGFCQDDARFVCKRGDMIGLSDFDSAYVSLEDQVRQIVLENGPIDIPGILSQLSATRTLCNDSGVRQILANSPDVIQVGRRRYDSLHRFFKTREEYDDLALALKMALLEGAKSSYALSAELAAHGLRKVSVEVIGSVLAVDDDVEFHNGVYHLQPHDPVLRRYQQLARTCNPAADRDHLLRLAEKAFGDQTAQRLVRFDLRFNPSAKPTLTRAAGSELQSLLEDFDF